MHVAAMEAAEEAGGGKGGPGRGATTAVKAPATAASRAKRRATTTAASRPRQSDQVTMCSRVLLIPGIYSFTGLAVCSGLQVGYRIAVVTSKGGVALTSVHSSPAGGAGGAVHARRRAAAGRTLTQLQPRLRAGCVFEGRHLPAQLCTSRARQILCTLFCALRHSKRSNLRKRTRRPQKLCGFNWWIRDEGY